MLMPSRLVLARKRRRMTLATLAKESGISVRSLTAYENDYKAPTRATLTKLAETLDFPIAFFEESEVQEVELNAISFRAMSKITALDRDSARSAGTIAVEINQWIESRFRLPTADVPTYPHLSPEDAAERLRSCWGLGESPISNMVHLLESHGIRVFSLVADCAAVDAFSFKWREETPFIFLSVEKSGERGRFDAAHELGHLVLHSAHRVPHGQEAEQEAQRFAAAFLMPRSGILAQMLRDADAARILQAKRKWKVAAMALTYRLRELGLTSEWGYRTNAQQLSRLGYRSAEPGGIPRETSQLLAKVFEALRREEISAAAVAKSLNLSENELSRYVFGIVPVSPVTIDGDGQREGTARPILRLVD